MESSSSSRQDDPASPEATKGKEKPRMPFPEFRELFENDLLRTGSDMTKLASEIIQFASVSTENWGFDACLSAWNALYQTLENSESIDSIVHQTWKLAQETAPELTERSQDNPSWKNLNRVATRYRNRLDARGIYLAKIRQRWGEPVYQTLQSAGVPGTLLRLCCAMCGVLSWKKMQCRVQTAAFNRIAWGGTKNSSATIIRPEDFWRALVLPEGIGAPSTKALENIRCKSSEDGFLEPISTSTTQSDDVPATSKFFAKPSENVAESSQEHHHSLAFSAKQQDAEDAEAKAKDQNILEVRKNHIDMMSRIALNWNRTVALEGILKFLLNDFFANCTFSI